MYWHLHRYFVWAQEIARNTDLKDALRVEGVAQLVDAWHRILVRFIPANHFHYL